MMPDGSSDSPRSRGEREDSPTRKNCKESPPQLRAKSVLSDLDPAGTLGPGVRLRDLDEEPLPELHLGPEKYRVLDLLGEGGMGRVYLAYDQDLKRKVALKMGREEVSRVIQRRFIEEAQITAQLEHPNILPLYELGLTEKRRPYYTMPVVRGRTLEAVLEALRRSEDETTREYRLTRLVMVFQQICRAVSYSHAKGVVHRDLKPGNVMIGSHGEVIVLDWGLSRLLEETVISRSPGRKETSKSMVMGTPWYMAPEQVQGARGNEASDIWALGVLLYELLTLELPFRGSVRQVIASILNDEPRRPKTVAGDRAVPEELAGICLDALVKNPDERPDSADQLYQRAQAWLEAEADKEARGKRADHLAARGRAMLEDYFSLKREMEEQQEAVAALRQSFKGWQGIEEKHDLYEARKALRERRKKLTHAASRTVAVLTQALGFDKDHHKARELLARYYWDRLQEAEKEGDEDNVDFFEGLVREYDDGTYVHRLERGGRLALRTEPEGATVELYELAEEGAVLAPRHLRTLGKTPMESIFLPIGSYLLVLRMAGYEDTRYPVQIYRGADWDESVRLRTHAEIGEGYVYVPAGPCQLGSDLERGGWCLPKRTVRIGDFYVRRHPVTQGEYLEFLRDVYVRAGIDGLHARSPARGNSFPLLKARGDRLFVPESLDFDPRKPVCGISWHDAVAYCDWRGEVEGRPVRLLGEEEWEKAARGVDGRWFPWGNGYDPSLCNTSGSQRTRGQIVSVDDFETDCSIYGVMGLGGNVRDWTRTEAVHGGDQDGEVTCVVKGGAWRGDPVGTLSAYRGLIDPSESIDYIGFRVARSAVEPST